MRKIALVATVAFALSASVGLAVPPTKAQQLQRYLTAVRPIAAKATLAQYKELGGVTLIEARGEPQDYDLFRASCRTLGLASASLKKLVRPAFLAEPHAALVGAWRSEAVACAKYANALDGGANPADPSDFPTIDYSSAAGHAREDERHWRTEVTIQLRRLGSVVPKWVTQVGASPLATG